MFGLLGNEIKNMYIGINNLRIGDAEDFLEEMFDILVLRESRCTNISVI